MYTTVDPTCLPRIVEALRILDGKWSFLILAQLYTGPQRFNELRRQLANINTKSLTDALRHLEKHEIIQRRVFPTVPVTVEYSLTEKGEEYRAIFAEMYNWSQKWGKSS
ncbi:transcriptional regulator [Ktedonosporobacter rubrisoli]|uniref:Transcriptional regulator n=1 Tax=Ktedonosporobacter rubrisoli TaxID=2509675 RepID=A0A4P6JJV7_KTERU|nr:helix-turn-helix domain-containing protein [Ktedonosporobacter rubrisoli]QBD75409.1 transcriptional regulator [Ktedonosporobacter rubrisoli]